MSGNIKFRWFLLAPIVLTLLVVVTSTVSWAGELEDAQEAVRQNPNDAEAHLSLGIAYSHSGQLREAIASFKEAIRIRPDFALAHTLVGVAYFDINQHQEAIASFKEAIRIKPDDADAHVFLGGVYKRLWLVSRFTGGKPKDDIRQIFKDAIASYKKAIRIKPDLAFAHYNLGSAYDDAGQYEKAIASYKEAIRINPDDANAHKALGDSYLLLGRYQEAIASYKEAIRIKPDVANARFNLGVAYRKSGQYQDAIASYKEALKIDPNDTAARRNLNDLKREQKIAQAKPTPQFSDEESNRLARERRLLEEERRKFEDLRFAEKNRQLEEERKKLEEERRKFEDLRLAEKNRQRQAQAKKKPPPQSGTGSGFFVSKMGHVITNAHVVQNCNKVTIGDNANKQVPAELINTDRSNDLALLKLSTLEMASAESKSLIQKLGIVVVPLASKGLLRSEDVKLGEKILVAGYPFGDAFSNSIKVTTGVVSSIRGVGDDSGQFQLDAAVQPGNSGGPIYDSSGNIVGVVISQLNKRTFGSLVENVNFGVKASTVRQFLVSSGLASKKSERTEEKSTEQLAEIAQNQALMVMCLQ